MQLPRDPPKPDDMSTDNQSPLPSPLPLEQDSDFALISKFVREAVIEETEDTDSPAHNTIDSEQLLQLLTAANRVLEKYPTNEQAVVLACQALPLYRDSLPEYPPEEVKVLQKNAFAISSRLDVSHSLSLVKSILGLTITLWGHYPRELPASCDMEQLANVVNKVLDPTVHGDRQVAIRIGRDFVTYFVRVLSNEQLGKLQEKGVYDKLKSLISFYEEIAPETLLQIVAGVGMFAEVKPLSQSFIEEDIHLSLLFAAQKYYLHLPLQQVIWKLLSLHSQRDPLFAKQLLSADILSVVVHVMKQEGYHLTPLLRFLTVSCHVAPNPFVQQCFEKEELIQVLLETIRAESSSKLEDIANACDFLAFLCSKCGTTSLDRVFELKLVSKLEDCARKWPDACVLPCCIAIEGIVNLFPPDQGALPKFLNLGGSNLSLMKRKEEFCEEKHHLFVKEMLSTPTVYVNGTLVDLMYLTFQKLLRSCTQDALVAMCDREFLEFFVIAFIRDTITFPGQVNRIAFTSHYFVFQLKRKEAVEVLKELNFHTAVVELVSSSESHDVAASAMALLGCLVGKYYDHLKDVKCFAESSTPKVLIEKAKMFGKSQRSHLGDDFSRILLNLTADKEVSKKLYSDGYLEDLLELVKDDYAPVIRRSAIHAVGNIALGGQSVKQLLLERKLYETLLHIVRDKLETADPYLLSACCRVLHILASGDWAKRKYVDCGCIEILLRLIKVRKDNPEVCWRPLGLLSSISFMAVVNRRYILTREIIDAVAGILKESTNGKVISYTTLVFLASGELDEGSTRLRELSIGETLAKAMENPEYKKQSPDLVRWGTHVIEKQNLYTISLPSHVSIPGPSSPAHDWPPLPDPGIAMEVSPQSPAKAPRWKLLPLEDAYLKPHFPVALELTGTAKEQLAKLGLNPNEPLFRIGRVYGSTYGLCSNCDKEGTSEELVIRSQGMTPLQYQTLIDRGWYRRGGVKMFRLKCNHNVRCCDWETRVSVKDFDHRSHKSYKKVLRRMPTERLTVETKLAHFNREAYDLYNEYHIEKHDKPRKSEYSYCEHIVNSPMVPQTVDGIEYGTYHQLYRLDGKLVAIGTIDVVPKGIISIYMWYTLAPEVAKFSFGVYSTLKEIEFVCELSKRNPNMQYYYLQGWNGNNKKLAYKANYSPEDFYCPCIVQDWVGSLEKVDQAREEYISRKRDKEREKAAVAGSSSQAEAGPSADSQANTGQSEQSTSATATAGDGSRTAGSSTDDVDGGGRSEERRKAVPEQSDKSADNSSKSEDEKPAESAVACEAFPHDLERYRGLTGESEVDVGRLVVCLNYHEYMRLGEVFERFGIGDEQRKQMEQRYTELVVALGPELASQLVIDLKACSSLAASSSEPMQV